MSQKKRVEKMLHQKDCMPFRNYIKIGRWSDIRCFLLIWKSIWVFFLRLEGCLLSDHLPPNKPNFYLIIRPSSTFPNIWYQTGRLSEYFNISYIRLEEFHICKYLISDLKVIWLLWNIDIRLDCYSHLQIFD